jgi:toxin YoeB
MGKYSLKIDPKAKIELQEFYFAGNQVTIKRIERIIEELKEHPETGIGQPERLKYRLSGKWSRRIDEKNRLIYQIKEDIITVLVISAKGHY